MDGQLEASGWQGRVAAEGADRMRIVNFRGWAHSARSAMGVQRLAKLVTSSAEVNLPGDDGPLRLLERADRAV